jgi:N,N-dimethylformamidase
VAPGETLAFKVGTYGPETYEAQLVKLVCGDDRPQGPGLRERPIDRSEEHTSELQSH